MIPKLSTILSEIRVQGNNINPELLGKRSSVKYIGPEISDLQHNTYYSVWECGNYYILYLGIGDPMYIFSKSKGEKKIDIDNGDWPTLKDNITEKIKNKDYILIK